MIKAFLFDLDGVITETSKQHFEAWKIIADEIGINIDLEFNEKLKGVSRRVSFNRILERGNALDKYSEEEINRFMDRKNEIYKNLIEGLKPKDAFPGVPELFMAIKEKGLKILICSASYNAPSILRSLDLEKFVDYIVSPDEIERGKPYPDIFLKGAEKFGLTSNECIGVEDAEAGIQAIKDANMYAIGIGNKEILRKADLVLESIGKIDLSDFISMS